MLLNDQQIEELCQEWKWNGHYSDPATPMIAPFHREQVTQLSTGVPPQMGKAISYGLSSVGYDIRIDRTIKVFKSGLLHGGNTVIDPKNFNEDLMDEHTIDRDYFDIPPHGYVLANSMEYFRMPDTVAALCLTKSTYARCGLLCNTTPLEPGWQGWLTLELANLTPLPLRVYVEEGIAQILFYEVERPRVTYGDRRGKYQGQARTPVTPRLK